jgi:hypothetical protein
MRGLVGRLERKKPLGRPRGRCEENTGMDLKGVRSRSMDWIAVAEDKDRWRALLSTVMNLRGTLNKGDFLTS